MVVHLCSKRGLWALLLGVVLLGGMVSPAQGQGKATGRFMDAAVVRVTNIANKANFINYGYAEGISILGGWVDEKANLTFTTDLVAGVDYLFLAGGDNDARDVDLEILDDRGTVVALDLGLNPEAIVAYTPLHGGRYTLRLTLFQSANRVPCVCVATILKKNGWKVPVKNLDDATGRVMTALEVGDNAAQRLGRRVCLRKAANQWAFYGAVLRQGDNLAIKNLNCGLGDLLFVGAGDNFAQTLRIDVENNASTQVLKQDLKNTQVSVLDYVGNGQLHALRVHNLRAAGPSVVLMVAMDIYLPGR